MRNIDHDACIFITTEFRDGDSKSFFLDQIENTKEIYADLAVVSNDQFCVF